MTPLDHRFFPRGGYSSSQWNHIENVNDVKTMSLSYTSHLNFGELKKYQNRSRIGHQRFECGLSA